MVFQQLTLLNGKKILLNNIDKMHLKTEDIIKLIPHREPFLFVDECTIVEIGKKGIATNKFKSSEFFFKGHFPGKPIVPGILIIEALAQTAGIVVSHSLSQYEDKSVLFTSVNKAKFRKPIFPDEVVNLEVNFLNKVRDVYKFYGVAKVNDVLTSESEFSAMITFNKLL